MALGRKTGGRKAGTPNRRTVDIANKLAQLNCDPLEGMARLAADELTPIEIKFQCFKELAGYVAPKRRAVAVEQTTPQREETREEMIERIKELTRSNPGLLELLNTERPKNEGSGEGYQKSPSISLVAHG